MFYLFYYLVVNKYLEFIWNYIINVKKFKLFLNIDLGLIGIDVLFRYSCIEKIRKN